LDCISKNMNVHKPVLLKEVLEILDPRPGQSFIDATINGGGHAQEILEKIGRHGKLLGIDWDCGLLKKLRESAEFKKFSNLILACENYANLGSISAKHHFGPAAGILFDLGFSSHHLEESKRGFSFLRNGPLDMRYNPKTNDLSAEKIINTWPVEAIEDILQNYGEERYARRIAGAIADVRRNKGISTTEELSKIILRAVPRRERIHPATRTFQALRIAVNGELENIKQGLGAAEKVLASGGKIAVISFHSLEDRIIKNFFKEKSREGVLKIITKKPIIASREEEKANPRSRSAKLRAAQKL